MLFTIVFALIQYQFKCTGENIKNRVLNQLNFITYNNYHISIHGHFIKISSVNSNLVIQSIAITYDGEFASLHSNDNQPAIIPLKSKSFIISDLFCEMMYVVPICSTRTITDELLNDWQDIGITYYREIPFRYTREMNNLLKWSFESKKNPDYIQESVSLNNGDPVILTGVHDILYSRDGSQSIVCHIFYKPVSLQLQVKGGSRFIPKDLKIHGQSKQGYFQQTLDRHGNPIELKFCSNPDWEYEYERLGIYAFIGVDFEDNLKTRNAVYIVVSGLKYYVISLADWRNNAFQIGDWKMTGNAELRNKAVKEIEATKAVDVHGSAEALVNRLKFDFQ
eukprot:NODE_366_length_8705_cov_0.466070.p1 type:complete len:336 gc:universal NODE_366_length_8705_cov_0.466070:1506-499(-)